MAYFKNTLSLNFGLSYTKGIHLLRCCQWVNAMNSKNYFLYISSPILLFYFKTFTKSFFAKQLLPQSKRVFVAIFLSFLPKELFF